MSGDGSLLTHTCFLETYEDLSQKIVSSPKYPSYPSPVTIDMISDRIGVSMDIMVYTVDKITSILMIVLVYLTYYTHSDRMTGKGTFITIYFIYPIM